MRWLGGGLRTRQGSAVLDALGILDDDRVQARESQYGGHFLGQMTAKGEGQVLNRSEIIEGPTNAEVDARFKLEPEWVAVVLLARHADLEVQKR